MKKILLIVISVFFVVNLMATNSEYKSQFKQDQYTNLHFFKNKKNGVFIDIGANDGITFSNTYFFEKELNWTGLCIEPIPQVYNILVQNRNCICIHGAIAETSSVRTFLEIDGPCQMLSGLINNYDIRHKQRIDNEVKKYGGSYREIPVQCFLLNDLLQEKQLFHIDLLSIDTEGNELEILKSIDFDRYTIDVITVENNYNTSEIKKFLKKKNFRFQCKLECDEVYRNIKFDKK